MAQNIGGIHLLPNSARRCKKKHVRTGSADQSLYYQRNAVRRAVAAERNVMKFKSAFNAADRNVMFENGSYHR